MGVHVGHYRLALGLPGFALVLRGFALGLPGFALGLRGFELGLPGFVLGPTGFLDTSMMVEYSLCWACTSWPCQYHVACHVISGFG